MDNELIKRKNDYIVSLGKKITDGEIDILNQIEYPVHLFFGFSHLEKSKTLDEMIQIKDDKWSNIITCIVVIKRDNDNGIDINILPPF